MAYLEENEWMLLNEIAYNISFIYSPDDMRSEVLRWLKLLINYDGAIFSLVSDNGQVVHKSLGNGVKDDFVAEYDKKYMEENPLQWRISSGKSAAYRESNSIS